MELLLLSLCTVVCQKQAQHPGSVFRRFTKRPLLRLLSLVFVETSGSGGGVWRWQTCSWPNLKWCRPKQKQQRSGRLEINIWKLFTATQLEFLLAPESERRDSSAAASGGFIVGVFLAGVILCLWEFAEVSFLRCFTSCHGRQRRGCGGRGEVYTWKGHFSAFNVAFQPLEWKK